MKTKRTELVFLNRKNKLCRRCIGTFIALILLINIAPGQPANTYQATVKADFNVDSSTDAGNSIKNTKKLFFNKFNVDPAKTYYGKLLNNTVIRLDPSCNAEKLQEEIPAGEVVLVYKFINKEGGCWAIKYKDYFGFVESSAIMPVQAKSAESASASAYDTPPELITIIRPKYPKDARKKKIKGSVLVKVLINKKGLVESAKVTEGIEGLNQSALDAVKKARFKPAKYKGKVVSTWVTLSIDFE
jgi:TonB family protein